MLSATGVERRARFRRTRHPVTNPRRPLGPGVKHTTVGVEAVIRGAVPPRRARFPAHEPQGAQEDDEQQEHVHPNGLAGEATLGPGACAGGGGKAEGPTRWT